MSYEYTCQCGKVIVYNRKGDFTKANNYKIKCSSCHQKEYVKRHRDRVLQSKHKWNINNRDYYKRKKASDINYRLATNLRIRLLQAIRKEYKSGHTLDLLGCSISEFKLYLENKFDNYMSWNNYASYWEIDHIIPCSYFDLTIPDNQKICFHYSNLQPLEKFKNKSKGNKIL